MVTPKNTDTQFKESDYVKLSQFDEHEKVILALNNRVGTNETFGKTFAEAAADSKSLEAALAGSFISLIRNNTDTQQAIGALVEKNDQRQWSTQLKGIWKIIAWVASVVFAALVGAFINSRIP